MSWERRRDKKANKFFNNYKAPPKGRLVIHPVFGNYCYGWDAGREDAIKEVARWIKNKIANPNEIVGGLTYGEVYDQVVFGIKNKFLKKNKP